MNIFAIVVTYNATQWIDKCFHSLTSSSIPLQILVVDNSSTDNTPDKIREKYPEVEIKLLSENTGFAKANNIGIKHALEHNAEYVFLLNQDAWIEKNTIDVLLNTFATEKKAGVVSPVHLNGVSSALDKKFASYVPKSLISDIYFNKLKDLYSVSFVNAAAWLISSECIKKVGGFDTSLFVHYGEDDNYCQRVLFHGFKVFVNTGCTICHDRENRTENYESLIWENVNKNLDKKVFLGNINKDFNKEKLIKFVRRKKVKYLIKLQLSNMKDLEKERKLLYSISKSRSINKKGGLVWLDSI